MLTDLINVGVTLHEYDEDRERVLSFRIIIVGGDNPTDPNFKQQFSDGKMNGP